MPEEEVTLDQIRKLAAEVGMNRLTDEHLQQLLRATKAARARRNSLTGDLGPGDEPAHVYTLDTGASR